MVESKYYLIEEVFENTGKSGTMGKAATQLMLMHELILERDEPLVVEFGVGKGRSTGILAHACEKSGGKLLSIDIEDCSDVIRSKVWTFIQSDDSDREGILARAPFLKDGMDLLYIDSLHRAHHVSKLLMLWYPYIKAGGYIALDDIDPFPYMRGQRKDNVDREIAWRAIGDMVLDFFYANRDELFLEVHYGSTGLAILHKLAPTGSEPAPPQPLPRRRWSFKSFLNTLPG